MNIAKKIVWISLFLYGVLWGAPYITIINVLVTDTATGLVWQKCSAGTGYRLSTSGEDCSNGSISSYDWSSAIAYCEALDYGGRSDWRLPNINELISLVVYEWSISRPKIDTTVFPNTNSGSYWSSTTYLGNLFVSTPAAWTVSFYDGGLSTPKKTNSYYVRCVTGP